MSGAGECGATTGEYTCSRALDHPGEHEAWGGDKSGRWLHVWSRSVDDRYTHVWVARTPAEQLANDLADIAAAERTAHANADRPIQ